MGKYSPTAPKHHETQVGYCRLATISTHNLVETNEFHTALGE